MRAILVTVKGSKCYRMKSVVIGPAENPFYPEWDVCGPANTTSGDDPLLSCTNCATQSDDESILMTLRRGGSTFTIHDRYGLSMYCDKPVVTIFAEPTSCHFVPGATPNVAAKNWTWGFTDPASTPTTDTYCALKSTEVIDPDFRPSQLFVVHKDDKSVQFVQENVWQPSAVGYIAWSDAPPPPQPQGTLQDECVLPTGESLNLLTNMGDGTYGRLQRIGTRAYWQPCGPLTPDGAKECYSRAPLHNVTVFEAYRDQYSWYNVIINGSVLRCENGDTCSFVPGLTLPIKRGVANYQSYAFRPTSTSYCTLERADPRLVRRYVTMATKTRLLALTETAPASSIAVLASDDFTIEPPPGGGNDVGPLVLLLGTLLVMGLCYACRGQQNA